MRKLCCGKYIFVHGIMKIYKCNKKCTTSKGVNERLFVRRNFLTLFVRSFECSQELVK